MGYNVAVRVHLTLLRISPSMMCFAI